MHRSASLVYDIYIMMTMKSINFDYIEKKRETHIAYRYGLNRAYKALTTIITLETGFEVVELGLKS